jgi:hypothetical protein
MSRPQTLLLLNLEGVWDGKNFMVGHKIFMRKIE